MLSHSTSIHLFNSSFPRLQSDSFSTATNWLHQRIKERLLECCDPQPTAWRYHAKLNAGKKGDIASVQVIINVLKTELCRPKWIFLHRLASLPRFRRQAGIP